MQTTATAALLVNMFLLLACSALATIDLRVTVHAARDSEVPPPSPPHETPGTDETILYTRVVADNARCSSTNGVLAMCASKNYVCRMPDGKAMFATAPQCLPFDATAQGANTLDAAATAPWDLCDPTHHDVNVPTCRLSLKCMCEDMQTQQGCRCVPPDAVPGRSLSGASCGKSKEGGACASGEYCKWTPEREQVCSAKPYYL